MKRFIPFLKKPPVVPVIRLSGTIGTGADNGYNGEYAGWTILSTANAGTAVVQGWEFSYQQQFTFCRDCSRG